MRGRRASGGRIAVAAAAVALSMELPGGAIALAGDPLFSTKSRADLFARQLRVLDTRAARQYENSARYRPDYDPDGKRTPAWSGGYRGVHLDMARAAARRHGVPEGLFLRLVEQESGWRAEAESPKGAYGLAQLMPETARQLGVDRRDPAANLDGGARYLRQMFERFRDWRLALAAYNAGPEAVERHGGIPPYAETRAYVKAIWGG